MLPRHEWRRIAGGPDASTMPGDIEGEAAEVSDRDLRLTVSCRGGLPLSVAGYLLRAIGHAWPGTTMASQEYPAGELTVKIPEADWCEKVGDIDPPDADGVKDDPNMVAFLGGLTGDGLRVGPPPWIVAMLTTATEQILDATGPENYVQMDLKAADGDWFSWIVCRPGRPSPHDLRRQAEQRVAVLEQQLRDLGVEPVAGPAAETAADRGTPDVCAPDNHQHVGPWKRIPGTDSLERCLACGYVSGK